MMLPFSSHPEKFPNATLPESWNIAPNVHSGITKTPVTKGKTSKTELLFVAKPNNSYTEPSTPDDTNFSPIILEEGRFIPVVNKFCYLRSIINHNLRESEDVDNRTKKASQAFGDLQRGVFTSKSTSFNVKKSVYTALILFVLLHGAEAWSLTETEMNRLICFHAQVEGRIK